MKVRILFADSDVEMLDLYRTFFKDRWYEVDTVSSGVECVDALRAKQPTVLALHRNLLWGGFDGVVDRIRHDRDVPSIPVVAIHEEEDERLTEVQPVVAALRTPFRLGQLEGLLRPVIRSCLLSP